MFFNPILAKNNIVVWIRDYFERNGPNASAVVGISGGKDSSVVAALCVEALGADRVLGVLMPNGTQTDISDSYKVCKHLGIKYVEVNIQDAYQGLWNELLKAVGGVNEQMAMNIPARLRMTTLYAVAQSLEHGGRVANTCNKSEDFVGYSTKFGDSAGDFSPLHDLTMHEVKQIGHALGLPDELVEKIPSDGLCGKTDEDNLGFTYEQLDSFIENGTCEDESINDRILKMHEKNLHKVNAMPAYYKIGW